MDHQRRYRSKHQPEINRRARERSTRLDVREYNRRRREERVEKHRTILIERLGGCCEHCGATDNLEFNHRYPGDKSFSVTLKLNGSLDAVMMESDKCQLLCSDCHRKLTSQQKRVAWQLLCDLSPSDYDKLINHPHTDTQPSP